MKTIGDTLALVLDNGVMDKAENQSNLRIEWNAIVEKVFAGKDINLKRAASHSRIVSIKNDVIFIETDHQGWIQILQTVQKKIISIINKNYPNISINTVAFLLVNNFEIKQENDLKCINDLNIVNRSVEIFDDEKRYENIKDEKLKNVLIRLEKRIARQS
jgi:hypothetical protein